MTTEDSRAAELELVRALTIAGNEPLEVRDDEDNLVSIVQTIPAGYQLREVNIAGILAPYKDGPARKTGAYNFGDLLSLIKYVTAHGDDDTEVMVSPVGITAVIDAHSSGRGGAAGWEQHRASYPLRESAEWAEWTGISGRFQDQDKMVEFLSSHLSQITSPPQADMLEIAESLEATIGVEFKSKFKNANGESGVSYEETASAKAGHTGQLEIPDALYANLRVFQGADPVSVKIRFRYRITRDKGLQLGITIDGVQDIRDIALATLRAQVAEHLSTVTTNIYLAG